MSFKLVATDRGLSALWKDKLLSSAYAAEREAQAWADRVPAKTGALVFVAGDPWGLASAALVGRGIRAIALVPGPAALTHVPPAVEAWSPGETSLEAFLQAVFDTTSPEGVVWEVWPAFERLAPELSLDWSQRFRDLFRTIQGTWLTQRRFGSRLWTNAVRNFLDWDHPVRLIPGSRPLVIAASGPSLDDGLDLLAQHRGQFDLWALPSSFETLVRRGLVPDVGVTTDAGFYAREHLHRLAGTSVPLLAALSSAPDLCLSRRPCLFFGQGLAVESALAQTTELPLPLVPSQGTVAITALHLALEATTGPVMIAGLDLCFRDLRGHTSPHTVDRRLEANHHRLVPGETQWASRLFEQATVMQDGERTSPALLTYARWLATRARFSRPVYRIAPSALRWPTMTEISWDQATSLWTQTGRAIGLTTGSLWPSRADRRQLLTRALDAVATKAIASMADDPWLIEVARTAVPEALADDFRARRRGEPATLVPAAFAEFVTELKRGLG